LAILSRKRKLPGWQQLVLLGQQPPLLEQPYGKLLNRNY
jgi:hypothetical protein